MPNKKKRLLNKQYHPDYRALYPGVAIPPKVLEALRQSDRKMEYIEWELKHSRVRRDRDGAILSVTPSREDSLERLLETNQQFAAPAPSPEELLDTAEERAALRRCLDKLPDEERALIVALYCDGLTERAYAAKQGLSKTALHARKRKAVDRLRKLFFDFIDQTPFLAEK